MAVSFYEILEVPQTASQEDIRKAYRKKAKLWHPDVNKSPDAHTQFQLLNKAYETLVDQNKRWVYDQRSATMHPPYYQQHTPYNNHPRYGHGFGFRYGYGYAYHNDDPLDTYRQWAKMRKEQAQQEARIKYEEFLKNRELFRNSILYYPTLLFIYLATVLCFCIGLFVIGLCAYLIFTLHFVLLFVLSPFICAGIYFIKCTGDWYKEAKRYF
jgi:hypothetical protein